MSDVIKPTTSFWVIAILALLWNLMGVMAYLGMAMAPAELMVESYGEEMAAVFASKPAWATGAFAIAVFGGVLGCIGLLLRKAWAKHLFILSLLAVIVHNIWMFMSGAINAGGTAGMIQVAAVFLIAIFLIWFAKKNTDNGVLR